MLRQILKLYLIYLAVWVIAIISFYFFTKPGDEMGYSLLFFYIIIPLTTLIISFFIGKIDFGLKKFLLSIDFGIMFMLLPYLTYSLLNTISFKKINFPDLELLLKGTIISLIGMGIGHIYLILRKNQFNIFKNIVYIDKIIYNNLER